MLPWLAWKLPWHFPAAITRRLVPARTSVCAHLDEDIVQVGPVLLVWLDRGQVDARVDEAQLVVVGYRLQSAGKVVGCQRVRHHPVCSRQTSISQLNLML